MKKILKWSLCIIGLYIIINIVYDILPMNARVFLHLTSKNEILDSSSISRKVPNEYFKLLSLKGGYDDSVKDEFYLIETTVFKYRNSVSSFIYNKNYYLQIYNMSDSYNLPLSANIIEDSTNSKASLNTPYSQLTNNSIEYLYKDYKPIKPHKIYLSLYGKNCHTILHNDSVAYYTAMMRNFSIRYDNEDTYDMHGSTKENTFATNYEPIEILFLKRDHKLYVLLMSTCEEGVQLTPNILYDLVKNK